MGFDAVSFLLGRRGGGGGRAVLQELSVSENGVYTPPSGVNGFSEVEVDVQDRYDEGYADGYTDGEAAGTTLESLSVSSNGTYIPEPPYSGFDMVTVDVPIEFAPLSNQAVGSQIVRGASAYDHEGNEITGTATAAAVSTWSSASLAAFPTGDVIYWMLEHGGGEAMGELMMTAALGAGTMTEAIPVFAVLDRDENDEPLHLVLLGGGSDGTMGLCLSLSGSTGLAAAAVWLISGGALNDLTSQADQILSNLRLTLFRQI